MWLVVALILVVTITVLSLLSGGAWIVRSAPMPLQKLLHVAFYAALVVSLLMTRACVGCDPRISIPLVAIGALGLGALLEWLQARRPGRFARIADVALDGIGVILGIVVWWVARNVPD